MLCSEYCQTNEATGRSVLSGVLQCKSISSMDLCDSCFVALATERGCAERSKSGQKSKFAIDRKYQRQSRTQLTDVVAVVGFAMTRIRRIDGVQCTGSSLNFSTNSVRHTDSLGTRQLIMSFRNAIDSVSFELLCFNIYESNLVMHRQ